MPDKAPFFHVARTSVRDLLRTFERRNGMRLWCSVRRSGKTTACLDLGSTSGDSTIVSQTCGQSDRDEARRFHESVRKALAAGEMLSDKFVNDVVSDCAPVDVENRRVVLVIDEYETLFEHLDAAAADSRLTRYNVVQPILNQLTSFSYENLLVLLGQEPGAHFIILSSGEYEFFRRGAADAMSERGFRTNPWLFATYWILRSLSDDEENGFRAPTADFDALTQGIPVPTGGRLPDPAGILRSASQANFLRNDGEVVSVKIRTLGRIASAVRPGLA